MTFMSKMDYFSRKNMGSVRFPILGIISSILTKYFLFYLYVTYLDLICLKTTSHHIWIPVVQGHKI